MVTPMCHNIGPVCPHEGLVSHPHNFLRRYAESKSAPVLLPPDEQQFAQVYARLNRETDRILSLHISRQMHTTWQNARAATQTLLGRCEIAVVDSQTASVGLALLVEAAAKMAEETDSLDDIVRAVRAMMGHIYAIFYVESLDYLHRNGLVSE